MQQWILGFVALVASGGVAFADTATHGLADQSRQRQQWYGDALAPYVVSGCSPAVPGGGGTTVGTFACEAYARDSTTSELLYINQETNTVSLSGGNGTYWLAVHKDRSTSVSSWTRQSGTHYMWRISSSKPASPANGIIVAQVVVSAGNITSTLRALSSDATKYKGVLNVQGYGAAGDGTTDDTNAVKAALAECPTHGCTIFFPPGQYPISSTLDLTNKLNRRFVCGAVRANNDVQQCDLVYTGTSGNLINADGTRGLEIAGMNLAYSDAAYNGTLINLNQTSGSTNTTWINIHDGRIGGRTGAVSAASLIDMDLVYDINIERNTFLNAVTYIRGSSVSVVNANAVKIRDNLFLQSTSGTSQIRLGGQGWVIEGNSFEPCTASVACSISIDPVGQRGLQFTGNWMGDATSGLWINLTGGALLGGAFHGNEIQGTGSTDCISLGAAEGVSIMGNMLECSSESVIGSSAETVIELANKKTNIMFTGLSTVAGRSIIDDATRLWFTSKVDFDSAGTGQSDAKVRMRNASGGNALEWGHSNTTGYASVLGHESSNGGSFVCLHCEHGTNANTFKTRGIVGRFIYNDKSGAMTIGRVATANADNQSMTTDVTFDANGMIKITSVAFANLGTPSNGTIVYCADCTIASPCAGAGTGALAKRLNGAWICN